MLCDYHVHSTYCDGKSTLRENVEAAMKLGMSTIGFSGHSYIENSDYTMSEKGTIDYLKEVASLKEEFSDKISILCGLEKDYYSIQDEEPFDYIIGSVHCVTDGEKMYDVDHTPQITKEIIDKLYYGDELSYCEAYYSTLCRLFEKVNADIIGHIDLINKFAEKGLAFDLRARRYVNACTDALDSLLAHNVPFEINTGAMSRGHRSAPYPSPEILRYIKEHSGSIIFNSDSHNAANLCYGFDLAKEVASSCGFKSRVIFTSEGKKEIEL